MCVYVHMCEKRHSCGVLTIPPLPPHNVYVTERERERGRQTDRQRQTDRDRESACVCVRTRMHARPYVKEETQQWCSNHTPAPME